MPCPDCRSGSIANRCRLTSLCYRIYFCNPCRRQFNERTATPFNNLQFPTGLVIMAVLWRPRYKLGFSDVAGLLLKRAFEASDEIIRNWELRLTPYVTENLRKNQHGRSGHSRYLDGTYVPKTASTTGPLTFVLSDKSPDRMGDVIREDGWQFDNFKRNPVALWAHNSTMPPIGKWSNLHVQGKALIGTLTLDTGPCICGHRTQGQGGLPVGCERGFQAVGEPTAERRPVGRAGVHTGGVAGSKRGSCSCERVGCADARVGAGRECAVSLRRTAP